MKLKIGVSGTGDARYDVTLSCDVTTTVSDAARALIRSGIFAGSNLEEFAALRKGHVTLLGSAGGRERLLDPAAPIGSSGLQSGWQVTVVNEFGSHAPRAIPAVGTVEIMSGPQEGAVYSLVPGANTIGRDPQSRVLLDDRSVSRRHAVIVADGILALYDLGSANGVEAHGQRYDALRLDHPTEVTLGSVALRIVPGVQAGHPTAASTLSELDHRHPHTRAPRVDPSFPRSKRELPQPPRQASPNRIPLLAILAPMMMGGAMYFVTRSPMSLMMIAFSPLMMIGSWVDNLTSGRRKQKRERRAFEETLAREREELAALRQQEIETRAAETPSLTEVAEAMRSRGRALWARRPEHRGFLELRFGEGTLPSRTEVVLPQRGDAAGAEWDALREIEAEFETVAPVPVLEHLDRCGSIGVAGDPDLADGLTRSLILQLVGLHSPAELVITAFTGGADGGRDWEWLKWLPHVDPVTSPIATWQLADQEQAATRLLIALEGVLEQRREGANRTVRSRLRPDPAAEDGAEPVAKLPPVPAVIVLVCENGMSEAHRSRLIALAEDGPDVGLHLIWVADEISDVPAACRTFVEVGPEAPFSHDAQSEPTPAREQSDPVPGRVGFVRRGRTVPLSRVEYAEATLAASLARSLAPVDDTAARALDESDLPRSVNLREVHGVDLLGGAAPVLQSWHAAGSLVSAWRLGEEREPIRLAAVVGQGAESLAEIDLRMHGPHALVGGTTGAGKSEFLQSWIMSLATGVSPERLAFLLVDYKGGAAFAECVDLPHTVGLVTDLSPHLVRRALTSLRAELRYREELLAEHGAKDLLAMERRSDPAAPPALLIVIDEFAALAGEVPEFVDGVIDIAQRGRSLGLHLIMATQRPAGVIKDNLRANTNLRIALRMADEADSTDVIGVKDAAFFDAETPGRGAIKIGPGRIEHFQTGYLGARTSGEVPTSRLEVRTLGFVEGEAWAIPDETPVTFAPRRGDGPRIPRDIERLRDAIVAAAEQGGIARPRKPWLDTLPTLISLDELRAGDRGRENIRDASEPRSRGVLIGLRDRPDAQAQDPVEIRLDEIGNLAIVGASGTGKTSALLTFASSISAAAEPDPVHLYAIDAAGGGLEPLLTMPNVGAVAPFADTELMGRVLRQLQGIVAERGTRFAAARASGIDAYRSTPGGQREPRVVLLIDGFSALRQATEMLGARDSPLQMLGEIMQTGRAVGVHVVLSADRPGALPSSIAASVQQQIMLRLASANDYAFADVPADVLEGAPPGRACFAGQDEEMQLALLSREVGLAAQSKALDLLAETLRQAALVPVPLVRNAPERVLLTDLPIESGGRPVYGIDTQSFGPVGMPLSGLGVIAGPAGSGLSTAALACATAFTRRAERQGMRAERVLLSFVPDRDGGLGGSGGGPDSGDRWDRVARGPEEIADLARELVVALGGKPPTAAPTFPGLSVAAPVGAVPGPGAAGLGDPRPAGRVPAPRELAAPRIIVVERPTEAEGTEALPMLVALAKAARRAETLVLFEFEQGGASGVWDLFGVLKQPRWGLVLQPDEGDGGSLFREGFGRVKRADFPPGRGFAVEGGRTTPVQVALVGADPAMPSQPQRELLGYPE
ncbi:MAG: FtsK/SpoIIIE domain-containing protein [Leucobacter sp.]